MKKLLKVLVVCLAMAMMLAGCGNGGNGGTSNEGGQTDGENSGIPTDQTLIMVTTQDPLTALGRSTRIFLTVW